MANESLRAWGQYASGIWYTALALKEHRMPRETIAKVANDPHQIRMENGSTHYLGATVLNLAIREGKVQRDVLHPQNRYVSPILLAQRLEMPASVLLNYNKERKKHLILLHRIGEQSDYAVDISVLHRFDFPAVDHRNIADEGLQNLVRRYKLSGFHPDYQESLFRKLESTLAKLARAYERRTHGRVPHSDLESIGFLGILGAAEGYSFSEGTSFRTYAIAKMRGSILDHLREMDILPRALRTRLKQVEEYTAEFESSTGAKPTDQQIMEKLGLSHEQIDEVDALRGKNLELSLETPVSDDEESTLEGYIVSSDASQPEVQEQSEIIKRALSTLPPDEQEFVVLRYWEGMSLKDVAYRFDISESRASQIESRIKLRLRHIQDLAELVLQ